MKSFLSSLAVSFVFLTNGASAYTSFAGSCPAGSNAGISPSPVPLDHTDFGVGSPSGREGLSGTLSDGATVLVINGVVMDPAAATVDFPSATDLVWEVQAVQVPFRGLLLRVEADEANTFTVTSDNADIVPATLCDGQPGNVVGLNHNSATNRDLRTGVMRFDGTGPVAVDVSVVYANRNVAPDNISVFAYSGFSINIVGASAPVETPAPAPVETPETPVPVPTDAGTPEPVVPTDAGTPEPVVPTDAGTPEPVVPTDAGTPEPVVPTDAGTPEPVVPTDVATPEPGVPTAGTEEDCPEGKGKKAKGEGKGKSGTKTGKGKSGTKTGKGKSGTKTGKGKGDGKGKKCKEPKTPKAGGSEKKVGKGGGDGKGKGELRSRN